MKALLKVVISGSVLLLGVVSCTTVSVLREPRYWAGGFDDRYSTKVKQEAYESLKLKGIQPSSFDTTLLLAYLPSKHPLLETRQPDGVRVIAWKSSAFTSVAKSGYEVVVSFDKTKHKLLAELPCVQYDQSSVYEERGAGLRRLSSPEAPKENVRPLKLVPVKREGINFTEQVIVFWVTGSEEHCWVSP